MKKNDKIIAILGVIILVVASIGVYTYTGGKTTAEEIKLEEIHEINGKLASTGLDSITVSDSNQFYPLIATPLSVNYNKEGEQTVKPLYIKNMSSPSESIERTQKMIGERTDKIIDSGSPKEVSLNIAEENWKSSEGALLIQANQTGYNLGVAATPLASYLSIPVIVTNETDSEVLNVLNKLGVTSSFICGDLEGYGKTMHFKDVHDILNASIKVVHEKFGDVNYVTLTNPIDAYSPKVLDKKEYFFGPETVPSATMNGNMMSFVLNMGKRAQWSFTIPEDYKYALIEMEGVNHNVDGVEEYGDTANFALTPAHDAPPLGDQYALTTSSGIPVRDKKGNIVKDKINVERVLYDRGGANYTVTAGGKWAVDKEGKVSVKVTVKKLEHPVYPMMEGLSKVSPYLTAYRKGIIFAKPSFAFTADDDVLTKQRETCPGFYMPGRNADLVPMSNHHVYNNIHKPLNKLLAKLADIPYESENDLKNLHDYYKSDPINIALVGGATVLPRYFYQNHVEPLDEAYSMAGGGTQSDNIYGNIDPIEDDWSNLANDSFSKYPQVENNFGRIIGWDAQDASTLVVRTIFYEEIIDDLEEWKNTYGAVVGGGIGFLKPLPLYLISKIPGAKLITNAHSPIIDLQGPWKYETGFNDIMLEALSDEIGEELGFNVLEALDSEGMAKGYSDDALHELKTMSLWNRLTFPTSQVKDLVGEGNVKGKEILESSNFIFINGHGSSHNFQMPGPNLVAAGFDGVILNAPNLWHKIIKKIIPPFMVGFWGPGGDLIQVGGYTPRSVSNIDFGPSVMWLESCFTGKINGLTAEASLPPAFIHSGLNSLIASTTGSNIPGGYLEPKKHMYDTPFSVWRAKRQAEQDAEKGIYPEFHFGFKIYNDLSQNLKDDATMGEAFREAKNNYLPSDVDWKLWWSPPLNPTGSNANPFDLQNIKETSHGGSGGYGPHLKSKYTSYREYVLYGDPAFNPYIPAE